MISYPADIYKLNYDGLMKLERMGDKSSQNVIKSVASSKNPSLAKFVFSIGIKDVGAVSSEALANHFTSLENIRKASYEELIVIDDIGEIIANNIVKFWQDDLNNSIVDALINVGIEIINPEVIEKQINSHFTDKTIVITGTFEEFNRNDLTQNLKSMGAKVTGSVSRKTDLLICGENAGSKLEKATSLGIRIITEAELKELL